MVDVNIYQENLFHTKMMLKNFELNNYLFKEDKQNLPENEQAQIEDLIQLEIEEIFNGMEKEINLSGL